MKNRRITTIALVLALALSLCVPAFAANTAVLTRGAFVTALCELDPAAPSQARQERFADVPGTGALAQAVLWATEKGITDGCAEDRFAPDAPVTREQMVTMLYRNARALGQAPEGDWMFPLGFADADTVSVWADEAMQWAVMNRIIVGSDRGLEPKALATEKQLSIVLGRWKDFLAAAEGGFGAMLLFTSDVHCGVDQNFGFAGLWEVRNALRAQGYDVFLVDDGDSYQGEPLGTMTKGEAIIRLMEQTGYDLVIPGNHDFDYGMERFLDLTENAAFPYISCNFNYKGELVFEPWAIREIGGRKIGFVGVTTPMTFRESTPRYFKDESGEYVYGFLQDSTGEGVYSAVQNAADAARAAGAEYVFVLAHLGSEEVARPWRYADVLSHTRGIDAMFDGHSHDSECVSVRNLDGESVQRAACGTKLAGIGWGCIAPDGTVSTGLYSWNLDASAEETYGLGNVISAAVASAAAGLQEKLGEVVASSAVELTINDPVATDSSGKPIRMVRRAETNLGDLCADAYLDQSGADIAFVNGGGVRANIKAGDITLASILSVHPFGNAMCVIEVSGQQILDALEWGAHSMPGEFGGFPQVAGLSYEIHTDIESPCVADEYGAFVGIEGERRVRNVLVGGTPIDPQKTYTLAGHNYMLLENGDGYTMFNGAPVLQNCVKLDNQVLIDYITETLGGVIGDAYSDPAGQGRITVAG